MLGIGFTEMIVIAMIALVAIGPEKFPEVAKVFIRTWRDLRKNMDDLKSELTEELRPVQRELRQLGREDLKPWSEQSYGGRAASQVSGSTTAQDLPPGVPKSYGPPEDGEQAEVVEPLEDRREPFAPPVAYGSFDGGGGAAAGDGVDYPRPDAAGDAAPNPEPHPEDEDFRIDAPGRLD
jgi:sec-independent protein translocase protein TatB